MDISKFPSSSGTSESALQVDRAFNARLRALITKLETPAYRVIQAQRRRRTD